MEAKTKDSRKTICHFFSEVARRSSKQPAFLYHEFGAWQKMSWSSYYETVEAVAAGFNSLGFKKSQRCAILLDSCIEWCFIDMALSFLGGISVPIYSNSTPEDINSILKRSQVEYLVVKNLASYQMFAKELDKDLAIKKIIVLDGKPEKKTLSKDMVGFDALKKIGLQKIFAQPGFLNLKLSEITPETVVSHLYTSGTTGLPKGVVITHCQIMSEVKDVFTVIGVNSSDTSLTLLPFAHILGRIEIWGHIVMGYTMALARGFDTIERDLKAIQPSILLAVPRIFEKIHEQVHTHLETRPLIQRLFNKAHAVAKEVYQFKSRNETVPLDLGIKYRIGKPILSRVSNVFGGKLRFAVSGGAPLNPEIAVFFASCDVLVLEGYGLTESTAAITVNTIYDHKIGSVGKPIGDVKIKIAEDGEILVQSQKICSAFIDDDGGIKPNDPHSYFPTGDIGRLDEQGYLYITDRKKDLIKTSGGKYIAPQKIENLLMHSPFISQAVVFGEQKKYAVALLILNKEKVQKYGKANGLNIPSYSELIRHPVIVAKIRGVVAETNNKLASFESIKDFSIMDKEFTVHQGDLTPNLKVKRSHLAQKYKKVINDLYSL